MYLFVMEYCRVKLSKKKVNLFFGISVFVAALVFTNEHHSLFYSSISYTKEGLRLATIFGGVCAAGSMIIALIYLVMKLIWWDRFPAGMAPMLIGMLFLGSVQLFFIGFLGEYIMSINQRVMKRPLVIEEERLNFDQKDENVKDGKANEV